MTEQYLENISIWAKSTRILSSHSNQNMSELGMLQNPPGSQNYMYTVELSV
jgi:hypothetical protein